MRRTEQEFKAEVMRRSEQYRKQLKKRRQVLVGSTLCCLMIFSGFFLMRPLYLSGGSSKEAASMDMSAEQIEMNAMSDIAEEAAPMECEPAADFEAEIPKSEPLTVKVSCSAEEITLDPEAAAAIMEYLSSEGWIPSPADCVWDYTIIVNGSVFCYHSDCGTIQDEYGKSLTLTDTDRAVFNDIMARCPMLIE